MTTPSRVLGLLVATATYITIGAASAVADEPNTAAWPKAEGRSVLDTLVFFGGATLGLIAVISLFALLTARNNFTPAPPSTELERASSSAAARH